MINEKQSRAGTCSYKLIQLALIIILLVAPLLAFSEKPEEPEMYFLQSWEALPDRTVALKFDGVSFRHTILEYDKAVGCDEVTVDGNGNINLLTHLGNNAFKYTLNRRPEFYKIGSNDWEWMGERTGQAYGKRK